MTRWGHLSFGLGSYIHSMTLSTADNPALPGLLAGVKVVDLTHYISGPYCTKLDHRTIPLGCNGVGSASSAKAAVG